MRLAIVGLLAAASMALAVYAAHALQTARMLRIPSMAAPVHATTAEHCVQRRSLGGRLVTCG